MDRILTYAEFSTQFDNKGETLGNTEKDVQALASSTDQFTADEMSTGNTPSIDDVSSAIAVESEPMEVGTSSNEPIKTEVEIITDDVDDTEDESEEDEPAVV